MRSNDMFLGNPYNIASYALLCHLVAFLTGFEVGKLVYMCGDCHLYTNHIEQAKELLSRDYNKYKLPTVSIRDNLTSIDDVELFHLKLNDYESYPSIKADVAV
jgi:thymidylate synthase